jgi:microcystin synthetase protein McyA
METVVVKLGREKTMQLIQEVPASYSIHLNAVFMTALFLTFDEVAEGRLLLDLEWHGRDPLFDDLDISRTTGWFTSLFPFSLDVQDRMGLDDLLKTVKEQMNAVPHGGITFGLLKYVTQDTQVASAFSRLPRAEVLFNYLGQMNQQGGFPGRQAPESVGPEQGPRETRYHLLEVNGILLDDELRFFWNFSRNFHRRATIGDWADRFIGHLTSIIRHCLSGESTGLTPSDFPQALVDQDDLDELLRQLN